MNSKLENKEIVNNVAGGSVGFDKTAWLDKLVVLNEKLDVLNELANNKETKDKVNKSEVYMVGQLYKLVSTMINCDQYDIDASEVGFFKTTKVARIYRYIPNMDLDFHNQDRIVAGGLFLEVPVYIISGEVVKKATKNRYGSVLHPEEFGLPSHDLANYGTLKAVGGSSYMVLAKGTWLDDWIKLTKHWDYVSMY